MCNRKKYLLRYWRVCPKGTPLVYLDETGFAVNTHRTHGWASRGQKVYGLQSAQPRPRTSLMGGYRDCKLIAPMLFTGTCKPDVFNRWLEHILLPELVTGSVIVLDNASFHKSAQTRQLVEQVGCQLLYLPAYSPDLNPIEKLRANLKKRWRKIGGSLDAWVATSNY